MKTKVKTKVKTKGIKKKSVKEPTYAFRVVTHSFHKMEIERFVLTSHTKTTVTYTGFNGESRTSSIRGLSHRWFRTYDKAAAYAQQHIQNRIATYRALIDDLTMYDYQIKANRFVEGQY